MAFLYAAVYCGLTDAVSDLLLYKQLVEYAFGGDIYEFKKKEKGFGDIGFGHRSRYTAGGNSAVYRMDHIFCPMFDLRRRLPVEILLEIKKASMEQLLN